MDIREPGIAARNSESERKHVRGKAIPLPGDDIDTDRIIPARYLKCVTFESLGAFAFFDERFDEEGTAKDHPLNDPSYLGHEILVVNKNFGCGSSREHAPQSLMRSGIRALIGESFAEIFSGNCTSLGIPAVRVTSDTARRLQELVTGNPELMLAIDLERKTVSAETLSGPEVFSLEMPEASRQGLMTGTWDTTGMLLSGREEIRMTARRLPYLNDFSAARTDRP